jgi:hypothetical protein
MKIEYEELEIIETPEDLEPEAPRAIAVEPVPVQMEWQPADGSIPKGVFMGAVRYLGEKGVKYKTRLLEGQLNRAYDYKTSKRIRFGEGITLTHHMPLPLPPKIEK